MSIDFIATRDGVDPHAAKCARLLTAVIVQAIRDCCEPTSATEREQRCNRNPTAYLALRWLFTPANAFVAYAHLIGCEAQSITNALLNDHDLAITGPFSAAERRVLQLRHRWWFAQHIRQEVANAAAR